MVTCPTARPSCLQLGGSGVLVLPMTYIFDEEPERWLRLLSTLGIDEAAAQRFTASGATGQASNGKH